MRIRYLVGVCLVLVLVGTSCKKEPETGPEEPVTVKAALEKPAPPEKATTERPVRAKPALEEPVRDKAAAEKPVGEKPVSGEAASERKEYFAVFMEGKKIGHAIQSRVVVDGNVITSEIASMTMSRAAVPVTMNMTETLIETTDGKPLGFKVARDMSIMTMKLEGTVDANGVVNLRLRQWELSRKARLNGQAAL
ncbi:MAG TPA: hypothetical protein HPP66_04630 [Planctomycetes bacterium]|nr:hypothetical protein [Planctomycetota bacterium]